MTLRLEALEHFVVLCEEKSMSRAAARLRMPQSTLSRQISSLEQEFGKTLYSRRAGAIELSPEGRVLLDYAQSMSRLERRAREDIAAAGEKISGTVCLGYGQSASLPFIIEAIARTREFCPDVSFALYTGDTESLIERMNRGTLDFMMECDAHMRKRYASMALPGKNAWALAVRNDSPLASKKAIVADDLVGTNLIASRQAAGSVLRDWAGEGFREIKVKVSFDVGASIVSLVKEGAGALLCYKELAEPLCKDFGVCIPLEPPIHDEDALIWRKDRALSPAAQAFMAALERLVEEPGAKMEESA